MHRHRFDDLTHLVAAHASRRTVLKALWGVAATGAGGAAYLELRHQSGDSRTAGNQQPLAALAPAGTPIPIEAVAPTAIPPAIALSAMSGAPGQRAFVTLSGFPPGESVELRISSKTGAAAAIAGSVLIAANGAARLAFTIPAHNAPGPNLIQAAGKSSGAATSTYIEVVCPPERATCVNACADLKTDAGNCGTCGNACAKGEICEASACLARAIQSIDAFFAKYDGVCVDFDGQYGAQCMDLAEYYNRDVVGAPQIGGDAVDAWQYYSDAHYIQIANGVNDVPQKGDLMVWNSDYGDGSGHIAICVEANLSNFTSFDQNWPTDSCCHYQYHSSYDGVIGWLRPKL